MPLMFIRVSYSGVYIDAIEEGGAFFKLGYSGCVYPRAAIVSSYSGVHCTVHGQAILC